MQLAKSGVDKRYLERIKSMTGLDYQKLVTRLAIKCAIVINKKQDEKFTSTQTERILPIDALYLQGIEVFQDREKLKQWLNAPKRALLR